MPDTFVPLQEFLRSPATPVEPVVGEAIELPEIETVHDTGETAQVLSEIRRFRAALADALDAALDRLLVEIASDVLARELQLAPADVRVICENARARLGDAEPLAVRAHPGETDALTDIGIKVVADRRLRRGDVVFDVRDGTIDMSLGVRLETVLANCAR